MQTGNSKVFRDQTAYDSTICAMLTLEEVISGGINKPLELSKFKV